MNVCVWCFKKIMRSCDFTTPESALASFDSCVCYSLALAASLKLDESVREYRGARCPESLCNLMAAESAGGCCRFPDVFFQFLTTFEPRCG